jgi:hypothetical protein
MRKTAPLPAPALGFLLLASYSGCGGKSEDRSIRDASAGNASGTGNANPESGTMAGGSGSAGVGGTGAAGTGGSGTGGVAGLGGACAQGANDSGDRNDTGSAADADAADSSDAGEQLQSCYETGGPCNTNADCCGFATGETVCVAGTDGRQLCAATCEVSSDCENGCCVHEKYVSYCRSAAH